MTRPALQVDDPGAMVRRLSNGVLAAVCAGMFCAAEGHAQATPTDPAVLWEQATIYRDEWGVPHIQADNLLAMAFAFGYAQADDHIEGMLKAYRVATGRAAEVYGEEYAASDEFSLKMGHGELALEAYPYADAITRDLCNGFALGVNAWLIDHPGAAPPWADGVRPEEILALMHCYLMSFAPFDLPGTFARAPASNTGNAWAIAPSRSTSGETILVMNPHTDYRGPFQWYEAQLTCGDLNIYGATLFGLPVILQGHNDMLGWALTPNMTDFADMYTEPDQKVRKKNPADPTGRRSAAVDLDTLKYLQMVANSKTYYVKTAGGMVERQAPFMVTQRGPVVGRYNNRLCSWLIGGYRDFGAIRQLHLMGISQSKAQFQDALALHQLPSFHVVYADREGNIFYRYNSKVGTKFTPPPPEQQILANRARNSKDPLNIVSWSAPVPGEDPRFAWGDLIAPARLPTVDNPASGFIQACGNPPWTATDGAEMDPTQYPPWFALDPDTFRAKRARRLLAMGPRSFEDAQAMVYDVLVPGAMFAVPKLLAAADANADQLASAHPDLAPCLDLLRNWNYVAEPQSEGMTVFHVWWNALCNAAPRGMNEFAIYTALEENSADAQSLALQAAEEAARMMRSEFQTLNRPWGDVHVFTRGSNVVPAPGSVSGQPLFVASDYVFENGAWQATYGYAFAMAVVFGTRTRAASMVPFGASEDPVSPHYDDQLRLLKERRLKPTRFDPEEVRRFAQSAYGAVVHIAPRGMEANFTLRARTPLTITSTVDARPPFAIPDGLATFTVYVQLEQRPDDQDCLVEMQIYVPEDVCAPENLGHLAVYAYDPQQGWAPLEAQQMDPDTRILTARDRRPRTYAVLGPAAARIQNNPLLRTRVAQAVPDAEPLIAQAEAALPPPEPATVPAPPPADMTASGFLPSADNPMKMPSEIGLVDIRSAAKRDDTSNDDNTGRPSPLADAQPPASAPAAKPDTPVKQRGLPTPAQADGVKEGALAWGTKMQLRPPGVEGLIQVKADKQVGARLVVSPAPAQPIPQGLAAFTEFVRLDVQGDATPFTVTVHLRPAAGVAEEHLSALKLYAMDNDGVWEPMADQSLDKGRRDFSAKDDRARTYALLGPASLAPRQTSGN